MQIEEKDIHPSLLRCGHFDGFLGDGSTPARFTPRVCYDYEIEYYVRSEGGVIIDGHYTPFAAGDISVRRPGQRVQGVPPYECYVLCVDLLGQRHWPEGYLFGDALHAQSRYQCPMLDMLPQRLAYPHGDRLIAWCRELERYGPAPVPGARARAGAVVQYLLADIAEEARRSRPGAGNPQVQKVLMYIDEHFTEDMQLSDLIAATGLSRGYFHRCFKAYCGQTPGERLLFLRMERAKTLLRLSELTVSEVARLCGFSDASYFAGKFKQIFGCTPRAYRGQGGV